MSLASVVASRRRIVLPPAGAVVQAGAVALLAIYAAALALTARVGGWLVDRHGAPGCFDFAEFWSAGRMVVLGHGSRAYDWSALAALLKVQGTHAFDTTGFPFFYPPPMLLALAPLGLLAFPLAAALWLGAGLGAWAWLSRNLCREATARWMLAASPAVVLCLMVGQTGLLAAVLAGGALLVLPRRPLLSALLLAGLAMKPQTALLFPLALLAAGRWKTLAACAGWLVVLAMASALAFGSGVWLDWLHALHPGPGAPAPLAGLPPAKLQSVYGLLTVLGLAKTAALAGQGACALTAAGWTVWLWRGQRPFALKAAGLCAAALLASPYSAVYDLPITTVALGFLLADAGRRPIKRLEGAALGVAWLLPLAFLVTPFPYGPEVCILFCGVVWARARDQAAAVATAVESMSVPA